MRNVYLTTYFQTLPNGRFKYCALGHFVWLPKSDREFSITAKINFRSKQTRGQYR